MQHLMATTLLVDEWASLRVFAWNFVDNRLNVGGIVSAHIDLPQLHPSRG